MTSPAVEFEKTSNEQPLHVEAAALPPNVEIFVRQPTLPSTQDTLAFAALRLELTHKVGPRPLVPHHIKPNLDREYLAANPRRRILVVGAGVTAMEAANQIVAKGDIAVVVGKDIGGQANTLISEPLHADNRKRGGGSTPINAFTQPGVIMIPGVEVDLSKLEEDWVQRYQFDGVVNATGSLVENTNKTLLKPESSQYLKGVHTIREVVGAINYAITEGHDLTKLPFDLREAVLEGLGKTVLNDGTVDARLVQALQILKAKYPEATFDPNALTGSNPSLPNGTRDGERLMRNLTHMGVDTDAMGSVTVVGRGTRETSRALDTNGTRKDSLKRIIANENKEQDNLRSLVNAWSAKLPENKNNPNPEQVDVVMSQILETATYDLATPPERESNNLKKPEHKWPQRRLINYFVSEFTRLYNPEFHTKSLKEFDEWEKGLKFDTKVQHQVIGARHDDQGNLTHAIIKDIATELIHEIPATIIITGLGTEPNPLSNHLPKPLSVPSIDLGFAVAGTNIAGAVDEVKNALPEFLEGLEAPTKDTESNLNLLTQLQLLQAANGSDFLVKYFLERSSPGYIAEWRKSTSPAPIHPSDLPTALKETLETLSDNSKVKYPPTDNDYVFQVVTSNILTRYTNSTLESMRANMEQIDKNTVTLFIAGLTLTEEGQLFDKDNQIISDQSRFELLARQHFADYIPQPSAASSPENKNLIIKYKSEIAGIFLGILAGAVPTLINTDPIIISRFMASGLFMSTLIHATTMSNEKNKKLNDGAKFATVLLASSLTSYYISSLLKD